jgi:uncharacterized protein YecT (DUF1311 family)
MILRILIVGILAIAAATPARADCRESVSEVDRLICGDPGLRELETKMSAAYDTAWSRIADVDRSVLAEEQRLWLMRRRHICLRGTAPNATEERKLKCLNGWAASHLERLQQWPQLGRAQMLVEYPPEKVCLAALERSNIGWSWDIVDSQDRFDPLLPPGAKQPVWATISTNPNIRYAQFDLLNEGTARDVYLIESDPDARIQFEWYVVVAADEHELIKRRIGSLIKAPREDIDALAKELRRERIEGYGYG